MEAHIMVSIWRFSYGVPKGGLSAWDLAWLKEADTGKPPPHMTQRHKRYREFIKKHVTDKPIRQMREKIKRYKYYDFSHKEYATPENYKDLMKAIENSVLPGCPYPHIRKCSYCNQEYIAEYHISKYCCDYCRESTKQDKIRKMKTLQRQKNCPVCGKEFKAKRSDAVYCSVKCRVKAHRKRKTDKNVSNKGEHE
jgi:predicted nucleic acid-binding Zn ribbon protein